MNPVNAWDVEAIRVLPVAFGFIIHLLCQSVRNVKFARYLKCSISLFCDLVADILLLRFSTPMFAAIMMALCLGKDGVVLMAGVVLEKSPKTWRVHSQNAGGTADAGRASGEKAWRLGLRSP